MQTRAQYLRAEAEKARAQGRKSHSATAAFTCFDLAGEMIKEAERLEREEEQAKRAGSDDQEPTP
jgi:hypothetical protein